MYPKYEQAPPKHKFMYKIRKYLSKFHKDVGYRKEEHLDKKKINNLPTFMFH
jgi:hypothetical protein